MPVETDRKTLLVSEGVPHLLRDLIHERTGVFFEDQRTDLLLEKLEPLVLERNHRSFLEFYYILKDNDSGAWDMVWNALSVPETYFWREPAQIEALVKILVPEWFRKSSLPFRIWSAACATGEEPYSIAIALIEAGFGYHPIEIVGSDASPAMLEKARSAIYRERAFRTLPPPLREKYFESKGDKWQLKPEVAGKVAFKRVNLHEPGEVSQMARVPVIFCRNVFIYFSAHAIRKSVAQMALRMPNGGHLFVGASESLLRVTTDFELQQLGGALVYVRK